MYVYLSLLYGSNLFLLLLFSYFLSLVFFHWGIVALHCCVSLCCIMKWISCVLVWVAQSCPTLCDCMDCSPPGSSVHGFLRARILEWVAIPFSRGSSWPGDQTQVFFTAGKFFTVWTTRSYMGYSLSLKGRGTYIAAWHGYNQKALRNVQDLWALQHL